MGALGAIVVVAVIGLWIWEYFSKVKCEGCGMEVRNAEWHEGKRYCGVACRTGLTQQKDREIRQLKEQLARPDERQCIGCYRWFPKDEPGWRHDNCRSCTANLQAARIMGPRPADVSLEDWQERRRALRQELMVEDLTDEVKELN